MITESENLEKIYEYFKSKNIKSHVKENTATLISNYRSSNKDKHIKDLMKLYKATLSVLLNLQKVNESFFENSNSKSLIRQILTKFENCIETPENINYRFATADLTNYIKDLKEVQIDILINLGLGGIDQEFTDKMKMLDNKIVEVDKLFEVAKTSLQKTQASLSGEVFKDKAKLNRNYAIGFFIATIVCFGLTIGITIYLFYGDLETVSNFWELISTTKVLFNLLIISFGAYITAFFARLFNTEKHLYEVNTHRKNSLDAHARLLESVIDTQNDKETKNIILSYMAKAIFEGQSTGYLKGQNNHPSPITQILETTKVISKEKG